MPQGKTKFVAMKPFKCGGKSYEGGDDVDLRKGSETSAINRGLIKSVDQVKEAEKQDKAEAKEATDKAKADAEAKEAAEKAAAENK